MITLESLHPFPATPGVYIMKDSNNTILYVGKAKNLKNRVKSYFSKSSDARYQIQFLMNKVKDITYIVTDTEKEALILENTLIKQHRPRYNINLRDDKTYFSIRLDLQEEFPRLNIIRRVVRDGARYFGPYASSSAARDMVKQLYRIFPLRHYPLETCRRRKRPCLFHQIGQCSAPCHGLISREKYAELAEGAALFLEGKSRKVLEDVKSRMFSAAAAEKYEEAARYRDLIKAIELTLEKQKVVAPEGEMDVVGHHREGEHLEIAVLFIRGGSLIGSRTFSIQWELEDFEAVSSFLAEYYSGDVYVPREVLVALPLDDAEPLNEFLSDKAGRKVRVTFPSRGVKYDLMRMAVTNAASTAAERSRKEATAAAILGELRDKLHLSRVPRKIECYDISNIQGRFPVGSRVSFVDGVAEKRLYRHYRIKSVEGANDFAMMKETLSRRFTGTDSEDRPDLIIVDGGIGQLNILGAVLEEIGIAGIDIAGLAKSRVESDARNAEIKKSEERVFLPGRKNPVVLRQNSAPLLLLAAIRDEAHRFAITYHQKLRGKNTLRSGLEDIPGIGAKRRAGLLRHFGSLKRLREAPMEEIAAAPGIAKAMAEVIYGALHPLPKDTNKEGGDMTSPPSGT